MRARLAVAAVVSATALAGVVSPASAAPSYRRVSGTTFQPTEAAVSGNGRYVVFVAAPHAYGPTAENLGGAPTMADAKQVWVKDLKTGAEPELVSVSIRNTPGNYDSGHPSVSADGRYVVFASKADNLVPGDTNILTSNVVYGWDVFVRDRKLRRTARISLDVRGRELNPGYSKYPAISADGSTIAYFSSGNIFGSPNFTAPPFHSYSSMYLYTIPRAGKPSQVRAASLVQDGQPVSRVEYSQGISPPALSRSGRYLASVAGDGPNAVPYVRDLRSGRTTVLTQAQLPPYVTDAAGSSKFSVSRTALDANGSKVVFGIVAATGGYAAKRHSLLLWDLRTGRVSQVDGAETVVRDPTGTTGDKTDPVAARASEFAMAGNGRYLVYTRYDAGSMSGPPEKAYYAGDMAYQSYDAPRVVRRDLVTGTTIDVVPCDAAMPQACLGTYGPDVSDNGSVVSFLAHGALDPTDPNSVDAGRLPAPTADVGEWSRTAARAQYPDDVYVRLG